MAITSDTVILVAPEFSSQDTDRIDFFITQASQYINRRVWGDKADYAHALYTAHLMTVSARSGSTGVTAERVGELSRNYATPTDNALGSTSYGSLFISLRKTLLISPIVVR